MEGEDVTDPDVLEAVETAVRRSMSVKRIKIEESYLRWTNVTTAILKGAAQSKPLREVKLVTPWNSPSLQEVVDDVRKANPKLQLVVRRGGKSTLHDLVVLSLVSSCCTGGGTPPHLTEGFPSLIHPVVPVCGGVDLPCTLLFTRGRKAWYLHTACAGSYILV